MIKTIFTDIGGVLLTNGWDHGERAKAVELFKLEKDEVDERHHLTFDTYEEGKITLDEYLTRTIFFKERSFSRDDFKKFMFEQSQPLQEMLDLIKTVKEKAKLQIVAVSNEGKELTKHRIHTFQLHSFIDFFVSSCYVHLRKPDEDIFRMALDLGHCYPSEGIYIDDRSMFVEVAVRMGLHGIVHVSAKQTKIELKKLGIEV
jgi:putative hydrolase of the HAD superfamily